MVVSTIEQPPSTYLTWTRFKFPHPSLGPVTAFAVPTPTYKYIQNSYALMSTIMVLNLWAIVMICGIYMQLTTPKRNNKVDGLTLALWNKRDAPRQSAIEALFYARKNWNKWWYYPVILILAGAWVASLAAGIFLPSSIFLGNAAPVNPMSIYVPTSKSGIFTMPEIYSIYELEGAPYLRAAGAALVASDEVRGKVKVTMPIEEGTWNNARSEINNESIQRIDYGYNVTGTDLGLQNVPQLLLTVTGSCVTDYSWLNMEASSIALVGGLLGHIYEDVYYCPWQENEPIKVNGISSPGPSATFCAQDPTTVINKGNISWGMVISSVDHISITPSQDPWYMTEFGWTWGDSQTFRVRPGRPALSCWQNDVWSFKDQSTDVTNLQSILPSDTLSNATADILARYLGSPAVASLGGHIGTAALQSYQATVNGLFDAGGSSIYKDLTPLILGAYIATINTLSDTTLYFDHNSTNTADIRNLAREENDDNVVRNEVGQFIVFSDQVASLSLTLIILIPFLALGSWVLMHALLAFTPLKLTKAMEPTQLLRAVRRQYGEPTLYIDHDGKEKWKFNDQTPNRGDNTISTEYLSPPLLRDDNFSNHHPMTHNQDHDEPATQLVSITAPRLDTEIPLLSPLTASHSFSRRDRENISRQVSATSSTSQPYHGFYDDDQEGNIEHIVGTNTVQHRPLMGYSDPIGEVRTGGGGGGGRAGGGYQHLAHDDEDDIGMGMAGQSGLRPISPLDENHGGRVSRATFR